MVNWATGIQEQGKAATKNPRVKLFYKSEDADINREHINIARCRWQVPHVAAPKQINDSLCRRILQKYMIFPNIALLCRPGIGLGLR